MADMSTAPTSPATPRQTLSKVPRRRPSTHLPSHPASASAPVSRAPSCPSTPHPPATSPTKSAFHHANHARKASKTHFADPPATCFTDDDPSRFVQPAQRDAPTVLERRRASLTDETTEVATRSPSLSIRIPSDPVPARDRVRTPSKSSGRNVAHGSPSSPASAGVRRSSSRPPRGPYPTRPVLQTSESRETTATYMSFDLRHPPTPKEERELRELMDREEARRASWWGFLRPQITTLPWDDEETAGERVSLLGNVETRTGWRYVMGEVVCYAKHMLPPILVFVALVLLVALFAYHRAIRQIAHLPEAESP
ncbi:hypothetical protein JCM11641_008196 [Rhodosporidiobolus odoratus]